MSALFTPITLRSVTLPNRIVVSPMCQYSAENGAANSWHLIHLGHLALSGAGMLCIEATAVESTGRITPNCLGCGTTPEAALVPVLAAIRRHSKIKVTMQIAHAGRKASSRVPWEGGQLIPIDEGGWLPDAPSSVPQKEASRRRERSIGQASRACATRSSPPRNAQRGSGLTVSRSMRRTVTYCTSSLSPIANHRTDEYGGSLGESVALPSRSSTPCGKCPGRPARGRAGLGHRLGRRWLGRPADDRLRSRREARCGLDRRPGGVSPAQKIALGPGYQVPFAQAIKAATGVTTIAVGLITEPQQAEEIVASGQADMVALARGILYDPRWPGTPRPNSAPRSRRRRNTGARSPRSRKRCSGRRGSAGVRRISPCRRGIAPWLFAFARD